MNRKRRTIIGDAWAEYREKVVPHSAGDAQVNSTRKAFYAGALSVISGMENAISDGPMKDEDLMVGDDVQAELNAFSAEMAEEWRRYNRRFGRPPA